MPIVNRKFFDDVIIASFSYLHPEQSRCCIQANIITTDAALHMHGLHNHRFFETKVTPSFSPFYYYPSFPVFLFPSFSSPFFQLLAPCPFPSPPFPIVTSSIPFPRHLTLLLPFSGAVPHKLSQKVWGAL